jgi:DNA-directed RNA polymerase subunit RPC12/RpoP
MAAPWVCKACGKEMYSHTEFVDHWGQIYCKACSHGQEPTKPPGRCDRPAAGGHDRAAHADADSGVAAGDPGVYSLARDPNGEVIGFWLRNPEWAQRTEFLRTLCLKHSLSEEAYAAVVEGNYRIAGNTVDGAGGCFLFFGTRQTPSAAEKAPASPPDSVAPAARRPGVAAAGPGQPQKVYQCEACLEELSASQLPSGSWSQIACPSCGGRVSTKPLVQCRSCGNMFRVLRQTAGKVLCPACRAVVPVEASPAGQPGTADDNAQSGEAVIAEDTSAFAMKVDFAAPMGDRLGIAGLLLEGAPPKPGDRCLVSRTGKTFVAESVTTIEDVVSELRKRTRVTEIGKPAGGLTIGTVDLKDGDVISGDTILGAGAAGNRTGGARARPGRDRAVVFTVLPVSRDAVEHRTAARQDELERLVGGFAALCVKEKRLRKMTLTISGYDLDPRELYEIPEVCAWAKDTIKALPVLPFFLDDPSRDRFIGWLCGPVPRDEIQTGAFQGRYRETARKCTAGLTVASSDFLRRAGADTELISEFYKQEIQRFQEMPGAARRRTPRRKWWQFWK